MPGGSSGFDTARFARLLALIAFVTAVFLVTARRVFEGRLFRIAVVAVGGVALVTAALGFLIASVSGAGPDAGDGPTGGGE